MRPKILFVCIGNACRSQMAEGFAKALSQNQIEAYSAGSRPAGFVDPNTINAMRDIGIDISNHYSKSLSQVPQEEYEAIITMGCGDACPYIPAKKRFDWQIPDPLGQPRDVLLSIRNLIRDKVSELLNSLELRV